MSSVEVLVDLRAKFGAARDQGSRPTCLAFAVSDAHSERRDIREPLSCEYLFFQAQRRANFPPTSGASLEAILAALRLDGQPVEHGWPYLAGPISPSKWSPPQDVGSLYARESETTSATVDNVIQLLTQGVAVILLMKLSASFYRPGTNGVIQQIPGELPQPERRHAIVAVGHGTFLGTRSVLIRNSWGLKWGHAGYAWLTEEYLKDRLFAAAMLKGNVDVSANRSAA